MDSGFSGKQGLKASRRLQRCEGLQRDPQDVARHSYGKTPTVIQPL